MSDPTATGRLAGTERAEALAAESAPERAPSPEKARGLWSDAWFELRRKPLFVIAAALITLTLLLALVPSLFTSVDPSAADLNRSLKEPRWGSWFQFGQQGQFGYDIQGRDIYSRTIHGARASIAVGVAAVVGNMLVGGDRHHRWVLRQAD
jgi:oligopeptide transport system permease protein